MSIAEKLSVIAENVPQVYWSGHSVGHYTGSQEGWSSGYAEAENTINQHLEEPITTINEYLAEPTEPVSPHDRISYLDENIPNVYDKGVTDGRQAEYDRFWNAYQLNGTRREYTYSFSGNAWDDEAYNPKYDIIVEYNQGTNMFRGNMSITNTKVPIRFRYVNSGGSTYVFNGCNNLATIPLLEVVTSQPYTGWFANCINLANITMSGIIGNDISFQWCPLTKDSITSVVSVLSDTASGKTVTFKKTAVNTAFGIDVDDTTTYPEGSEFYTLRHSKDNWSFNYV